METGEKILEYRDVYVSRAEVSVLRRVNLEVRGGDFVYLVGKVGSGKSSLLKSVYGAAEIVGGEARAMGYDLRNLREKESAGLRRQLGIVFQDFRLLDDCSVQGNLDFVLRCTGTKKESEREARIEEALRYVGMSGKGYKMPHELSGGEQQRIVIARAIINRPRLILADEPTGNLDPETGREIVALLRRLAEEGTAVMMATHNMKWLSDFRGRAMRIEGGEIEEMSPVEVAALG